MVIVHELTGTVRPVLPRKAGRSPICAKVDVRELESFEMTKALLLLSTWP